jgi:MFS family permease
VLAVAALVVATLLGHMFLAPVAALLQNLAGVRRRATAAAFYLFLVNLVSMGLGPVAVGFMSDRLGASLGNDALRYSLLAIITATSALASCLFLIASRKLPRDLTHSRTLGSVPASFAP